MYKKISTAALAALTILSIGCSIGGDASATNAADTLTRRQKDEIISTLPIPGARGVGRALEATDLAAARANSHDSLAASLGL
jgi:hypothetical protein